MAYLSPATSQTPHRARMECRRINDKLHNNQIKTADRITLICSILVALTKTEFSETYSEYETPEQLVEALIATIKSEFIDNNNINIDASHFSFLKNELSLRKPNVLAELIDETLSYYKHIIDGEASYDIVSEIYIEFLRYSNPDRKLGIVLTPQHIADFAVELVGIDGNSNVLDSSCGTGAFLSSALKKIISCNGNFREEGNGMVLGIEYQPFHHLLASMNMFLLNTDRHNILRGDCFEHDNAHRRNTRINAGLINPPFDKEDDEFRYLLETLEYLQPGSLCACILPMKCALNKKVMVHNRVELMKNHSVLAVFSMPEDIFSDSNVNVQTAIFLVEAHKPHTPSTDTFLALCSDDGFIKTRNLGRVDANGDWENIKSKWLNTYRNKQEIKQFSISKNLGPEDTFCAEAHVEIDYSGLSTQYFQKILKKHVAYRVMEDPDFIVTSAAAQSTRVSLNTEFWERRSYGTVFKNMRRGNYPSSPDLLDAETHIGEKTLLIGASKNHNGSNNEYVEEPPAYSGGYITVGNGGNTGAGQAFYQAVPFNAKTTVNLLELKDIPPDPLVSLFLVGLIRRERTRYYFGRGWSVQEMRKSEMRLPVRDGEIDYEFIRNYMRQLSYSSSLVDTI